MRKMYTAYLSYPDHIDVRIRSAYDSIIANWDNKRSFEFKPMIPLWKIYLDDGNEHLLAQRLAKSAPLLELPLTTSGLEPKPETGYIFITFDTKSSDKLITYSEKIRASMNLDSAEDNMPFGFVPHTSLIKQDPSELNNILTSIKDTFESDTFIPKSLVLSRATESDHGTSFDIVFEYRFKQ